MTILVVGGETFLTGGGGAEYGGGGGIIRGVGATDVLGFCVSASVVTLTLSVFTTDITDVVVEEELPPGMVLSGGTCTGTTNPTSLNIGGGGRGKSTSSGPLRPAGAIGGGGGGQDDSGDTVVGGWGGMRANEIAGIVSVLVFSSVACVDFFLASSSFSAASLPLRFSTAFTNIPFIMSLTLTFSSFSVTLLFPSKSTFCSASRSSFSL